MKTRRSSISGFSLVEVTLALGVVVFCLVSVFGLLAVGVSSTTASIDQTAATNILTSIAADLESTAKAGQTSPVFGITLPLANAATAQVSPAIYIGEDGQKAATAATARYQLNVWTTGSTATRQESLVRLVISWPPQAPYANAQGYVETVIALNRT
jgi:Tfp pilus assembly protein PilV